MATTNAEQEAKLEARLVEVEAAISRLVNAGQSFGTGDGTQFNQVQYNALIDERTRTEKSLQRLRNGGRGMAVDLSYTIDTTTGAGA